MRKLYYNNDDEALSTEKYPWYDRLLAGEDGDPHVDYSVLSVGVMTLGLILVVEVLRHRIDHAALGRPFFKAVLEGVYSECKFATPVLWESFSDEERSSRTSGSLSYSFQCYYPSGHSGNRGILSLRSFHLL
jgi:hypothetical protein